MPSQSHLQAKFVPISPDYDLHALVEATDNLKFVPRLSLEKLKQHSIQSFEALVLRMVIQGGKPLVIEGWESNLPSTVFSKQWLEEFLGKKQENVWDIANGINIPMTVGHYLRSIGQLSRQFTDSNYRDSRCQRLYLKDIDCPDAWAKCLEKFIPESIYYLNECIDSRANSDNSLPQTNKFDRKCDDKNIAPAGDLMSSLPSEMRALNLMCYIGHEGTYTAAHREMCATLGHNIMVEASKDQEDEKEGSSIWFMTETNERELVSEYFSSILGHDIEIEKHFAQVNAWKKAPFKVWVVDQKVGDLILIPPLAPHQVWNRGTRTIKAAWNRTTVDTLELALYEALPRCRMVCRDEQYKCKAIIFYTLLKYYKLLGHDQIEDKTWMQGRTRQVLEDFKRLFYLYQEVLINEIFSPKFDEKNTVEMLPYDSNVVCSYCRCDIFNRFLTCKECTIDITGNTEDTYDICMDCYAMGRSCACISTLTWVEQWDWKILEEYYELWRSVIVRFDSLLNLTNPPKSLDLARKSYGKKSMAEVCQEQSRIRIYENLIEKSEPNPGPRETKYESDDQSWPRARNGRKSNKIRTANRAKKKPTKTNTHYCHICLHSDWDWKLAFCTSCSLAYCYGVLWRAFDLMPQAVMQDNNWKCPKCLKICSCRKCRKNPTQKPYQPKGILLGHNTKKVADERSVERLVDFSRPNLIWLRDDKNNIQASERMKRLREKIQAKKDDRDYIKEIYFNGSRETDLLVDIKSADYTTVSMNQIDPSLRDYILPKSTTHDKIPQDNNQVYLANKKSFMSTSVDNDKNSRTDPTGNLKSYDCSGIQNSLLQLSKDYLSPSPSVVVPATSPKQIYPDPRFIYKSRGLDTDPCREGIVYRLPILEGGPKAQQSTSSKKLNTALSDVHDPSIPSRTRPHKKRTAEVLTDTGEDRILNYSSPEIPSQNICTKSKKTLKGKGSLECRTTSNLAQSRTQRLSTFNKKD